MVAWQNMKAKPFCGFGRPGLQLLAHDVQIVRAAKRCDGTRERARGTIPVCFGQRKICAECAEYYRHQIFLLENLPGDALIPFQDASKEIILRKGVDRRPGKGKRRAALRGNKEMRRRISR